jgi:hypothetical protein
MAEEIVHKVRYELSEDGVKRWVTTNLEFQGPYPFVVLPPPMGWPRDKSYPRALQALDAALLDKPAGGEAIHSYSDVVVRVPQEHDKQP